MDHKILPGDVYVTEFGAVIRTKCPKESVTDEMVHQRVVAANLAAGDFVKVQCFNHEKTTLLSYAEYLVYDRQSEMMRTEVNDRETRQVEALRFSVIRTSDWTDTPAAPKKTSKAA